MFHREINFLKTDSQYVQTTTTETIVDETADIQCNLTSDLALRALNRAKSEECRRKIETIGCLLQNKRHLHAVTLPRQCPLSSKTKFAFDERIVKFKTSRRPLDPNGEGYWLGCFKDNVNDRIFKAAFYDLKEINGPNACMAYCLRVGQEAAGVLTKLILI